MCCVEHDYWLICARNNRLGNGDQVSLLIENAQSRGLPIARIELGRRALRGSRLARAEFARAARLNFAPWRTRFSTTGSTVARGNSESRFSSRITRAAIFPAFASSVKFGERHGMIEREFPHGRAGDFREVRARAVKLSHVVRQRTNVGARAALDRKTSDGAFDSR